MNLFGTVISNARKTCQVNQKLKTKIHTGNEKQKGLVDSHAKFYLKFYQWML